MGWSLCKYISTESINSSFGSYHLVGNYSGDTYYTVSVPFIDDCNCVIFTTNFRSTVSSPLDVYINGRISNGYHEDKLTNVNFSNKTITFLGNHVQSITVLYGKVGN